MSPNSEDIDLESVYSDFCSNVDDKTKVIFQNVQRLNTKDDLFFTDVLVQDGVLLRGMLDSGSMACTISCQALDKLIEARVLSSEDVAPTMITLIGCGGQRTTPQGVCDVQMKVFNCSFSVPALIVDGQNADLILGSNVIKHLIHDMKVSSDFWGKVFDSRGNDPDTSALMQLLSNVESWKGTDPPTKVGSVKLKHAVTLEPMKEHIVWGKLFSDKTLSAGSTVIVEPSTARTAPRNVLVGRIVVSLWCDGSTPVKVINPSSKPICLRRNCKLADVYTCMALEDFDVDCLDTSNQQVKALQCNVANTEKLANRSSELCEMERQHCMPHGLTSSALSSLGLQDVDIDSNSLTPYWRGKLVELLVKYESIFSRHGLDCGKAKGFVHRICLSDTKPFRLPYRRLSPSHYEKLREALDEMEERDIIRKSASDYASPLVLVWKRNGDLRLCTDFRWLNARTVKDAHPLPHQADALAALGGNAFFSTMDLTSGYYNVEVHEDDKRFTAFTTPFGLYEYNRLPQGLCNSPATFMRMMMNIFGDQNFMSMLCYLDDILVFAPDEQLALERLEMVFQKLKAHNLKLSQKKCHFMKPSVKFLGHIVSSKGVATDPDKVRAIDDITEQDLMEDGSDIPSQTKLRSFLGMVVFYQQYIEGCSRIGRPLFALTSGMRKPRHAKGQKRTTAGRKLTSLDWTQECRDAFNALKQALLGRVVLAHPNFDKPFLLSVDASSNGLGAVLSQVAEGEEVARPIAFASKSLNYAQSKYPAHRLEFFALKWAVCEKFSHWLRGQQFSVWTDNNPLTYILTKPKLDACEQRWVAKLAPYNFDIKYIPGPKNVVADALSREPFVQPSMFHRLTRVPYGALLEESRVVNPENVQDVFRWSCHPFEKQAQDKPCSDIEVNHVVFPKKSFVSQEDVSAILNSSSQQGKHVQPYAYLLPQLIESIIPSQLLDHTVLSRQELMELQHADPVLSRVFHFVERKRRPSRRERSKESPSVLQLLRHWNKLSVKVGLLYRVSKDVITKDKTFQFIVPSALRDKVLKGVHDEAGHQGQHRTLYLTRHRFYWQGMEKEVKDYVRCCKRCVVSKSPEPDARAPLESIRTSRPLELVCVDFWSAEDSSNKSLDVLVVTDHFTKLAQAYLCPNQSAKAVAKQLWDNFFCIYGFPERVHSDQGACFESSLISEMLQLAGVQKSHTTPYHPMGNGAVERFNRTLGNMIRALPPKTKHRWPQMLKSLTFCYNATIHETTSFPPFQLMFGRTPRLPIDMMFDSALLDDQVVDYNQYVQSFREDLTQAMKLAQCSASKQQQRQANLYNKKIKGAPVNVGDRVLLANKRERGKRKTADRWESCIYIVTEMNSEVHTFRIRNTATGTEKVVHRNLIMPVNFLPLRNQVSDVETCENVTSSRSSLSENENVELSLPVNELNDRTVTWVSELPVSQDAGPSESDSVQLSVDDQPTSLTVPHDTDNSRQTIEIDCRSLTYEPDDDKAIVQAGEGVNTDALATDHVQQCSRAPSGQGGSLTVRTRCGRVVKPVIRLIQNMHQKVLSGL